MSRRKIGTLTASVAAFALLTAPFAAQAQDDEAIDLQAVARLFGEIFHPTGDVSPGFAFASLATFGVPESPFGDEVDVVDGAVLAVDASAATLTAPNGATNINFYPDGLTQDGDNSAWGAVDDEFAVGGNYVGAAIRTPRRLSDDFFVEYAVLASLDGFNPSMPDALLENDPNTGFTHRFGISNLGDDWNVNYAQWDPATSAWVDYASPADIRADVQDDQTVVSFVLPPRFSSPLSRLEAHYSSIPVEATDRNQAFFMRSVLPLPLPSADGVAESLTEEQLARSTALGNGVLSTTTDDGPPGTDSPVTDNPATEEPVEDDPVEQVEQPVTEEKPVTEQPAEQPVSEQPVEEEPVEEEPVTEQPADDDPVEEPVTEPVVETGGDGGMSPVIPIGAAVLGAAGIGGVVVYRRRQPSPLALGDESIELPMTPAPSPLAPADGPDQRDVDEMEEIEWSPDVDVTELLHPVENNTATMASAPDRVVIDAPADFVGQPEPETDLSDLLDTPEQRALTERLEQLDNPDESGPDVDWGDGLDERVAPLTPAQVAARIGELEIPLATVPYESDATDAGYPSGNFPTYRPTRPLTWQQQADQFNAQFSRYELDVEGWRSTAEDMQAASSMTDADEAVNSTGLIDDIADSMAWAQQFAGYFVIHRFEDCIELRDFRRLGAFFGEFRNVFSNIGDDLSSTADAFLTAYEGWQDIFDNPELLATLPPATADAARSINRELGVLARMAERDDPEFARRMSSLTQSAMFESVTGYYAGKAFKAMKGAPDAPSVPDGPNVEPAPMRQAFDPDEVAPLPNTRKTAIPSRQTSPADLDLTPAQHRARAERVIADPDGYGCVPGGATIEAPLGGVTPTRLQTHANGCVGSTLESMVADLPVPAMRQDAIIHTAQRLGDWKGNGLLFTHMQRAFTFLSDVKVFRKPINLKTIRLDRSRSISQQLAQVYVDFPDAAIGLGLRWKVGNVGHAVRFEGFDDLMRISISDPGLAPQLSVRLTPEVAQELIREVVIAVP